MSSITLYHGSEREISRPTMSLGRPNRDFGRGFYCTDERELSMEWACARGEDGVSNRYSLGTEGLRTLDLADGTRPLLEWVALIADNRVFDISEDSMAGESIGYLREHHLPDISGYDVIRGYRADNHNLSFTQSFLENGMSLEALEASVTGMQTVLVSEKALRNLTFVGSEHADADTYHGRSVLRDLEAVKVKRDLRRGRFILGIMEGAER